MFKLLLGLYWFGVFFSGENKSGKETMRFFGLVARRRTERGSRKRGRVDRVEGMVDEGEERGEWIYKPQSATCLCYMF